MTQGNPPFEPAQNMPWSPGTDGPEGGWGPTSTPGTQPRVNGGQPGRPQGQRPTVIDGDAYSVEMPGLWQEHTAEAPVTRQPDAPTAPDGSAQQAPWYESSDVASWSDPDAWGGRRQEPSAGRSAQDAAGAGASQRVAGTRAARHAPVGEPDGPWPGGDLGLDGMLADRYPPVGIPRNPGAQQEQPFPNSVSRNQTSESWQDWQQPQADGPTASAGGSSHQPPWNIPPDASHAKGPHPTDGSPGTGGPEPSPWNTPPAAPSSRRSRHTAEHPRWQSGPPPGMPPGGGRQGSRQRPWGEGNTGAPGLESLPESLSSALAYLFGVLFGFLLLWQDRRSEPRFHATQAIAFDVVSAAVGFVLIVGSVSLTSRLGLPWDIFSLVFWIALVAYLLGKTVLTVLAFTGTRVYLPGIGDYAKFQASRRAG